MATLSGRITNSKTPIEGVTLRIRQYINNTKTFEVLPVTGSDGTYSQSGIPGPPASYTFIQPEKTGYSFTPASITIKNIGVNDNKSNQDFIGQTLSVSGSVNKSDGTPIKDIDVRIVQYSGSTKTFEQVIQTSTDGKYELSGLVPGRQTGVILTGSATSGYLNRAWNFSPGYKWWMPAQFTSNQKQDFIGSSYNIRVTLQQTIGGFTGIRKLVDADVWIYQKDSQSSSDMWLEYSAKTDENGEVYKPIAGGRYTYVWVGSKQGTPLNVHYSFTPTYKTWTSSETNQDLSIVFDAVSYQASGRITTPNGLPVKNVDVKIQQFNTTSSDVLIDASVKTNDNGNYLYTEGLAGGRAVKITPSKTYCYFTPQYRSWSSSQVTTDLVSDFQAACPETFTVTGRITTGSGIAVPNVNVNASGAAGSDSAITSSTGYYSLGSMSIGSYTVRPEKEGCTFTPSEQIINVSSSMTNVNFTANCPTVTNPVAIIDADATFGSAPLTVSFDGTQSYDPGASSLTYSWDLADNATSTDSTASHTYEEKGDYKITLTVTNSSGITGSSTINIVVGMPVRDAIGFKTGPLRGQCFPLIPLDVNTLSPVGEDSIGKYIEFQVPTNYKLSSPFPSSDDSYDTKWFLTDFEDTSLIGAQNVTYVNNLLDLSPHVYDGNKTPTANPSLAVAKNYLNKYENSQFAYLTYQAWEDNRWKVYLKQLRLSEYSKPNNGLPAEQITDEEVIYRIVCTHDSCVEALDETNYRKCVLTRSVVMEILLEDGREVYNADRPSGNWGALCPGVPAQQFPKERVFVKLDHSMTVLSSSCDSVTEDDFDELMIDWETGQRFYVPYDDTATLGAESLFNILKRGSDASYLGNFGNPPNGYEGLWVFSSIASGVWLNEHNWAVMSDSNQDPYQGTDIDEPILVSTEEQGHCLNPVIKVDYNNDIYIAYETTQSGISQIVLIGTREPQDFLPNGVCPIRKPDNSLNYFVNADDFVYKATITSSGINQSPDMFVDLNNNIHLTWQSNRDNYWEIYYAISSSNFANERITKYESKSMQPRIDGDEIGNLFITWHDNRFGNWEIMIAYKIATRTLPLMQQDAYLANIRNTGYLHYSTDPVPLVLTNEGSSVLCISSIAVNFYKNRMLENSQFSVTSTNFPFAFTFPEGQTDLTSNNLDFSPYISGTQDVNLPEVDTQLMFSDLFSVTIDASIPAGCTILISFRGSEEANDPNASMQWTTWVDINPLRGSEIPYTTYGTETVSGRYKQARLSVSVSGDSPTFNYGSITSLASGRICLAPNQTSTAYLYLNPEINGTPTQLPLPIYPNQTYFIGVTATDDGGTSITMPDQKTSISRTDCIYSNNGWDYDSCTIQFYATNTNSTIEYYNFHVTVYSDPDLQLKVIDYWAKQGSPDMAYFMANGQMASTAWQDKGLVVPAGESIQILLIPNIDSSDLRCGVRYFVDIKACTDEQCDTESSFADYDVIEWTCNCSSSRLSSTSEAVDIFSQNRWKSSGLGLSDVRISDTRALGGQTLVNNLNPIIKMRSNLNGVVLYQSNRDATKPNTYSIYASVFNAVPNYEMYASGAQQITSAGFLLSKMDIPISTDAEGSNPSFDIDLFDNLLVAWEVPNSSEECSDLEKSKDKKIKIHRCGVAYEDILFSHEIVEQITEAESKIPAILDASFTEDYAFDTFVRQIRVENKDVDYHITYNQTPTAVVSKCDVHLEIIGTAEVVAIRLKNGTEEWSSWYTFEPLIGEYSMSIPWSLSPGSGIKTITFQIATPAGLTASKSITVLADYKQVNYDLLFYRLPQTASFNDETAITFPFADETNIFKSENELNKLLDLPVAGLRAPIVQGNEISTRQEDFVFLEVIPSADYMNKFKNITKTSTGAMGIEPVFDVITQGASDQYGIKTYWIGKDGTDVFRGVFKIKKEGLDLSKDGLASVVVHFIGDCYEKTTIQASEAGYIKDQYNLNKPLSSRILTINEVWEQERDRLGKLAGQITIRPSEDPYFAFGDPNYRLKNEPD